MRSVRRFLARPLHPPNVVVYSFLLGRHFVPPETTSILEVGCGIGVFALRFAAATPAARVLAIDHSQNVIEYLAGRCTPLFPNLNFATADFCDDAVLTLGPFDVVYSSDVIEHVYDVPRFIRHAHAVLEKGGSAVVNFPNLDHHGINHFSDTRSIADAFDRFSEVQIYDVVISGYHDVAYTALRALYERVVSPHTHDRRAVIYTGVKCGVDCFEHSTCYEFARTAGLKNTVANLVSALILVAFKPTVSIRPISGVVRNRERLVVVARK